MGIGNSKNIYDKNVGIENIDIKETDNFIIIENIDINEPNNFLKIENDPYYKKSLDNNHTIFNKYDMYEQLDEQDIEGIFASYKIEFSTKSKTMRIIEELNNKI
jgi:hypothetical protein